MQNVPTGRIEAIGAHNSMDRPVDICEKEQSKETILYIDEVHTRVRGLICQGCIATRRLVREDPVLLQKFITYITPVEITS